MLSPSVLKTKGRHSVLREDSLFNLGSQKFKKFDLVPICRKDLKGVK